MTKETIASDDYILDMFEERYKDCGNLMTEGDAENGEGIRNDKRLENERIQDNAIVKETLSNVEEGNIPMEQSMVVYDTIHEELRAKTQLLKKAKKKIEGLANKMSDLQRKFESERTNYLETIRKQNQQIKLTNQIIDKIQPLIGKEYNYSNIQKIRTKCYWDEENQKWHIPELVVQKKIPTPGVRSGKRRSPAAASAKKYFDDSSDEEFFRELEKIEEDDIAGPSVKRRRRQPLLSLDEGSEPTEFDMTMDTIASSDDSPEKSEETFNQSGKLTTECGTQSNDKGLEGETNRTITKEKGNVKNNSTVTRSKCKYCDFVCSSKGTLMNHYKTHSNPSDKTCEECGSSFSSKEAFRQHLLLHSNEKPFTCELCGRAYKEIYHLSVHMQRHHTKTTSTNEKPYKCKDCGKSFANSMILKHHLATHSDERPYSCDICMSTFKLKHTLQGHLRVHKNDRPFKCETCDFAFKRSDHLKKHMLTVHVKEQSDNFSDEKPYECNICMSTFKLKHNFQIHLRVHKNDRPFECETCGFSFKRSDHLKKLMLTVHEKEQSDNSVQDENMLTVHEKEPSDNTVPDKS